ncbi:MAG: amidohydrolase family protein, partial [Candidatus Binatia bacterium]
GNAESKVRQGVTLDIIGESQTVAPLQGPVREEYVAEHRRRNGIEADWTTFTGYFQRLMKDGIAMNVASGVSPQQVKRVVVGFKERPATAKEQEEMNRLIAQAMEEGALGLTSAWHSRGPEHPEEVVEMARVVKRYGGYYGVHVGSEGYDIMEELEKALRIGREVDIAVHIYHLKTKVWSGDSPRSIRDIIGRIEEARREGLDVTANQYPYAAFQHPWHRFMPRWLQDAPRGETIPLLKDRGFRERIIGDPEFNQLLNEHGGWKCVVGSRFDKPELKPFEGMTVAEIAKIRGQDPANTCFDLIVEEGIFIPGVYPALSEDDVRTVMRLPWVSVASDGSAFNLKYPGKPHPRSFGTNPRVLGKYVREEKVLALEEAIRKMTSLPAQVLRLKDRGLIREGYQADIVVLDPDTVTDIASFDTPKQYAHGVEYVLVNGALVIDAGHHTGARPGRVLYGPGTRTRKGQTA